MDATSRNSQRRRAGRTLVRILLLVAAMAIGRCTVGEAGRSALTADAATSRPHTCSMHPQVRHDGPGACPFCAMDLVPVTNEGGSAAAALRLSALDRENAGIETALAARRRVEIELSLPGSIEADETLVTEVVARADGWVDSVAVESLGQEILAGRPLMHWTSPDLIRAVDEYVRSRRRAGTAPVGTRDEPAAEVSATRRRLELLGFTTEQIESFGASDPVAASLGLVAPVTGLVLEKSVVAGRAVSKGQLLFELADLRRVRARVLAAQSELAAVGPGTEVCIACEALPGREWQAAVTLVEPELDPSTRRAVLRIDVDNADRVLRPGMLLLVRSRRPIGAAGGTARDESDRPLTIPASAPLRLGARALVWLESPDPDGSARYVERSVELGPRAGGLQVVLAGLEEGERVVSRGAFRIDAAAQIAGRTSLFNAPPLSASLMKAAVELSAALAADDLALSLAAVDRLRESLRLEAPVSRLAFEAVLPSGRDLDELRASFAEFSDELAFGLGLLGHRLPSAVEIDSCPMARGGRGARWVQVAGTLANPYFGRSMTSCGSRLRQVPPVPGSSK